MTLETFFANFNLFADAPDAVSKMRVLVLELAVRGALSERVMSDDSEPAWLEFVACRERAADSALAPFEIPDAWRWVCLNDLGDTKVRNDAADDTTVSFVPMTLIPSGYGLPPHFEARAWGSVKKGFTHFADGDVVMAKITPCFENGKSVVMRGLLSGLGAGTTELHVFRRGTPVVIPEFVVIYLKSQGFIARGEPRMTGSAGQKRVPHDYFAASPFPLPPPAEQKRIVAKVDELMALCDQLEAQQEEREARHAALARASVARFAERPTATNLQFLFHKSYSISPADLRRSILTLAVQGKLVPNDPADELVEDINPTVTRPQSAPVKEIPFDLPSGWRWRTLGDVSELINGDRGANYPNRSEYIASGVPFINAGHIEPDGTLSIDRMNYITPQKFESLRSGKIRKNDLLYCLRGALGKTAVVHQLTEGAIASSLVIIRLRDVLLDRYVYYYLTSPFGKQLLARFDNGSAQPNLSANSVKKYIIPIPPFAEQERIVRRVDGLLAVVDALELRLVAARTAAKDLLDAVLAQLTSQERSHTSQARESLALVGASGDV